MEAILSSETLLYLHLESLETSLRGTSGLMLYWKRWILEVQHWDVGRKVFGKEMNARWVVKLPCWPQLPQSTHSGVAWSDRASPETHCGKKGEELFPQALLSFLPP